MELGSVELPALYRSADKQAETAQNRTLLAVKASLGGAVIGAIFGAVSIGSGAVDWSGVIAAAAFLIASIAAAWLLWAKPEMRWYEARAAAESSKTLAWQYGVGGGEFARTEDSEDAVRSLFLDRIGEVLEGLEILLPPQPGESQLTSSLAALRESSLEARRSAYLSDRISEQRSWYASKAQWNETRRIAWTVASVAFLSAGLVFGVARAFLGLDADLLGPAAAAAGSAMAWARSKDYADLAAAYAVTAHELALIEAEADTTRGEGEWASFVQRAEQAISREHTLWKARRGKPRMGQ